MSETTYRNMRLAPVPTLVVNPLNHYWIIGGSTTEVYSSATNTLVPVDDTNYTDWLVNYTPSPIASEQELADGADPARRASAARGCSMRRPSFSRRSTPTTSRSLRRIRMTLGAQAGRRHHRQRHAVRDRSRHRDVAELGVHLYAEQCRGDVLLEAAGRHIRDGRHTGPPICSPQSPASGNPALPARMTLRPRSTLGTITDLPAIDAAMRRSRTCSPG